MGKGFMFALATYFLLTQLYLLLANTHPVLAECQPNGQLPGTETPTCNNENDSECCKANVPYDTYDCSPPVTSNTPATMTLNSFEEGGDGGDPSECDQMYHSDTEMIVALSTGWFDNYKRCNKSIRISGNGRSVLAKVVDQCDSAHGCDPEHSYQQPCGNNVVDASKAIWDALGYSGDEVGEAQITWSDA